MKRIVLITAMLLLPLSEVIAGGWYVGGMYGGASGDTSASALNEQLAAQGLNATASSTDDNRTAWQLYLEYRYTPNWGVQLGYGDLGSVETTFSGTTSDINSFLASAEDIHPQTARGWNLSGLYRYPLGESMAISARLGALVWRSEYTLSTATASREVSDQGVGAVFGVGFEYELFSYTYAHLNYDQYDVDGEAIDVISAGLSYWLE